MRVCIHRGSKEIGGSCVEVISGGKRLLIDLGLLNYIYFEGEDHKVTGIETSLKQCIVKNNI
jgi:hypothetical protein